MEVPDLKPLFWAASSKADFLEFPESVQNIMGYALYLAQAGGKHGKAKPLKGFGSAGVLEMAERYDGDAYRAVYTVTFEEGVYVLHAFQKKSKAGIATPPGEIRLVKDRLRALERMRAQSGGRHG